MKGKVDTGRQNDNTVNIERSERALCYSVKILEHIQFIFKVFRSILFLFNVFLLRIRFRFVS